MESRRTWKNPLVVSLLAAALWAQQPGPAIPAKELTLILNETVSLLQKTGAAGTAELLDKNRLRIQQGYTTEVYALVTALDRKSVV